MFDIEHKDYLKLKENDKIAAEVQELLIPGETILASFAGANGNVVFTSSRIILIGSTGKRGKRTQYDSLLYKKLSSFSIDTSGRFERDAGLTVVAANIGSFSFEFKGRPDLIRLYQHIAYTTMK